LALAFVATALLAVACTPSVGDDDAGSEDPDAPIITDLSPNVDDADFFYQASLWVEWNNAPEGATYSLSSTAGVEVAGTTEYASQGRVLSFTPGADLSPSTAYVSTISWNSPSSPLSVPFQTGAYGNLVEDETSLIGKTYNLDLANADFVEPPGVGPILQSQIGDVSILFSVTHFVDPTDPIEMHILGALGDENAGIVSQDICAQTLGFTSGPDGEVGTADDIPAGWADPVMEMGPTNLTLSFQGIDATIQDLNITGTFHPSLSDMHGGTFAGRIDTRPLAPELDPDGGEDAICELVSETVGVDCEECGEPNPGVFCLTIYAENVNADEVADTTLVPRTCDLIINDYIADPEVCADAATAFDADADEDGTLDGLYLGCPEWAAGTGTGSGTGSGGSGSGY
jgi:hypothetical protein